MEGVARRDDLPGQPARAERLVAGEGVGEVPRLVTAASLVVSYRLCDGLHLTLVTVCTYTYNVISCKYIAIGGNFCLEKVFVNFAPAPIGKILNFCPVLMIT